MKLSPRTRGSFDRRDSVVFQRDKPKPQYAALNNCLVSVRFSRVIRAGRVADVTGMKGGGCAKWKTTEEKKELKQQRGGREEGEGDREKGR